MQIASRQIETTATKIDEPAWTLLSPWTPSGLKTGNDSGGICDERTNQSKAFWGAHTQGPRSKGLSVET